MLQNLSPQDAGVVIAALVSALLSVVGFAVWLLKYILDSKDERIRILETQNSGAVAQIAANGEAIARSLDTTLGIVREMRVIQEMQARLTLPAPDERQQRT
jgi:hypothetical protein